VDDGRTRFPPCHGCGVRWASPNRRFLESICSYYTFHSLLPSSSDLNFDRERHCFACSSSSCFLSSASSRTSSSYDRTKPSPRAPSTRCSDTFLLTSLPRAPISTSPWGYSQQHTSCKLAPSSSETGSFATNCHAPLSRTM
jgi:hypothetical protein